MRTRIKICGITRVEDALAAIELGADAVGFIFSAASPRVVNVAMAAQVARNVPSFVTPVGVFVNETAQTIRRIVEEAHIRAVQLHGDESEEFVNSLPYPAIKVYRIPDGVDLAAVHFFRGVTHLVDSYDARKFGGPGSRSNWAAAVRAKEFGPVILSGGLTPENVGDAIRAVRPYAVDVSSGVERAPGRKDRERIARFVEAVRDADARILHDPVSNMNHSDRSRTS